MERFEGLALGYEGETAGEVVFNTAMTGYQEVLTDPSYKGQIVTMTCPQIGNYGVTAEDDESRRIWAEGFIVKESSRLASNWRHQQALQEYLAHGRIVAIEGIDTRALTRHLREKGSQQGWISIVIWIPAAQWSTPNGHRALSDRIWRGGHLSPGRMNGRKEQESGRPNSRRRGRRPAQALVNGKSSRMTSE